jgi:hypothetical protein
MNACFSYRLMCEFLKQDQRELCVFICGNPIAAESLSIN